MEEEAYTEEEEVEALEQEEEVSSTWFKQRLKTHKHHFILW